MQEKIIKELRKELKDQIEENKELNDSITWWENRYEAQVKINEEHKKINGELRKEIDGLVTVIDLVREYVNKLDSETTDMYEICNSCKKDLLEILERANESEVN